MYMFPGFLTLLTLSLPLSCAQPLAPGSELQRNDTLLTTLTSPEPQISSDISGRDTDEDDDRLSLEDVHFERFLPRTLPGEESTELIPRGKSRKATSKPKKASKKTPHTKTSKKKPHTKTSKKPHTKTSKKKPHTKTSKKNPHTKTSKKNPKGGACKLGARGLEKRCDENGEPVLLKEFDIGFLDPEAKNSKIYHINDQMQAGERKVKSDKKMRQILQVQTTGLGPCFALGVIDEKRGGMLAHFPPAFCQYLSNSPDQSDKGKNGGKMAKEKLEKVLSMYKKDLSSGHIFLIHGPASSEEKDKEQLEAVTEIMKGSGLTNQINQIHEKKVPKVDGGLSTEENQVRHDMKFVSLTHDSTKFTLMWDGKVLY